VLRIRDVACGCAKADRSPRHALYVLERGARLTGLIPCATTARDTTNCMIRT
jgi:hypothetical protein